MTELVVEELTKKFGDNLVVDNISFTVPSEKFVTILGPSGCGKTTVLRCIVGVEKPDEGKMNLGDKILFSKNDNLLIPTEKRGMGMVYQSYALWPHLTVFENVAYPLQIRKIDKNEIKKKVLDILKLVKLDGLEERLVPNLSGGQQQRVSLARALVYNPSLLLLDEPLSNLDVVLRDEMRTELKDLQRRLKLTTIYVTHDRTEALSLSDHIIIMDKGVIKASGTPIELLRNPPNSYAGIILGDMSLIRGKIKENNEKSTVVRLSNDVINCRKESKWEENEEVGILIRGTEVIIHNNKRPVQNVIPAKIKSATYAGQIVEYKIIVNEQVIKVPKSIDEFIIPEEGSDTTTHSLHESGEEVFIEIPESACHLVKE
ncbi:MAG: polyamine ABC transporter ATP-binding protein [Thaumarchaeota archaeon]|nr:polyamine ABC transporter ATP-binding protein [Nitrososphaerota archaeon]|tara:strand:+ start:4035 stop:5153 length:1119 start_codon:yes stop_codon:yes gene_type:complete